MRTADQQHQLWWQPGAPGRGVLFDSGLVCTWPEGDATHRQFADRVRSRPVLFFYIRRDGRVRIPERHARRAPQLMAALSAADERLAPFAPPSHAGPIPTPPSERAACPPPPAGARPRTPRRSIYHAWDEQAAARLARIQRRY